MSQPQRTAAHHVWGFTIGVAGFTVQPLWWHYKYKPSREYLDKVAYPAVRDVAGFYANFIGQCQVDKEGKVVLAPSVSPEHWGGTPKFERNRNCTFDIAVPAVPVFPGAVVTWWPSAGEKDLFARTIENLSWNGNNSTIILAVA